MTGRLYRHVASADLTLGVEGSVPGLDELLEDLQFVSTPPERACAGALRLVVGPGSGRLRVPGTARERHCADGFRTLEEGDEVYVTDGESLLHVEPQYGYAGAEIAESFFRKPALLQRNFWAFGPLKLMRRRGFYCLHGAALQSPSGAGLLIVGPPGCGKSTLAIGLIRAGWCYLSDDALLLRRGAAGIEALALRKHFFVDSDAQTAYADLPLGDEVPDTCGRPRRRLHVEAAFQGQFLARSTPRALIFPRIVPNAHSRLAGVTSATALNNLLAQSGPQLFDRATMSGHLETLAALVKQADVFELASGSDLHREPGALEGLLAKARGSTEWPASS